MKDDIRNELEAELEKVRTELHNRDVNSTRIQLELERCKEEEKELPKDYLALRIPPSERNNQLECIKGHQMLLHQLLGEGLCDKNKDNARQTQITLADAVCMGGHPSIETQTANNHRLLVIMIVQKRWKHLSDQRKYTEKNKGGRLKQWFKGRSGSDTIHHTQYLN
ncbi:hypothetical protein ACJMK2_037511 [Sinanodonta woodiana]|uniref:Uncharacterized protein n=1 Tax=Sinanodonta woodiana TaxID=1069815 RepID=A0ABD3WKK3_SINWO